MSADVIQFRDYKSPEERQIEIDRIGLAIMSQALGLTESFDDPEGYIAPEDDCA